MYIEFKDDTKGKMYEQNDTKRFKVRATGKKVAAGVEGVVLCVIDWIYYISVENLLLFNFMGI